MSSRRAKRQGTIEAPRDTIKTVQKKIKVGQKTMYITEYHKKLSITIYIGSSEIYCIDMQIFRDADNNYDTIGILSKVRWDGECSLHDPFERGSDTIMIFELAMTYIKQEYSAVTAMKFTDVSTRECDNGASVSLAAMKVFTDGVTWYESRFHARIDPANAEPYKNIQQYANKVKETMTWDLFQKRAILDGLSISITDCKIIYEKSDTWQAFFKEIRDTIGASAFCIWLSKEGWFDNFVQMQLNFHLMSAHFLVDVEPFYVEYQVESIVENPTKGGSIKKIRHGTIKKNRSLHLL